MHRCTSGNFLNSGGFPLLKLAKKNSVEFFLKAFLLIDDEETKLSGCAPEAILCIFLLKDEHEDPEKLSPVSDYGFVQQIFNKNIFLRSTMTGELDLPTKNIFTLIIWQVTCV